ncbi:MAG: hypothetical protein NT069_17850, partial [Planctomycetota bacterium]|nr:hypothetical protein [Planctomycetota bacterium]
GGKGGTLLRVTGQATVNVADNLTLKNGAIVTARTATTSAVDKLHLIVAGTLSIDASSSIDVTGKGYLPGRTTGNTATGASTGKSGGSYGGSGGTVDGAASEIYGDYSNPQDFGSGGSGSGGTVTAGGGLVEIQATNLIVDGRIRANAESANLGSGSGGGIKITTGILSGTGTISANGGSSNAPDSGPVPGSGGGGRVAVYAADLTTFDTSKITAYGGSTGIQGAAGTVYLRDTDLNMGTLIVNAGTGGKGGTLLRVTGQATVNTI